MIRRLLIASVLMVGVLAGCSSSGSDGPEAADTTTTATVPRPRPPHGRAPPPRAPRPTGGDPWTADAQAHRGDDGEQFDQDCPTGGEADTIWGVELYTDDSSIYRAVHVGLITFDEGGTVTYEIAPGEERYESGIASDITLVELRLVGRRLPVPRRTPGSGREFEPGVDSGRSPPGSIDGRGRHLRAPCGPDGEPGRI